MPRKKEGRIRKTIWVTPVVAEDLDRLGRLNGSIGRAVEGMHAIAELRFEKATLAGKQKNANANRRIAR